jgi:hypothetical protein
MAEDRSLRVSTFRTGAGDIGDEGDALMWLFFRHYNEMLGHQDADFHTAYSTQPPPASGDLIRKRAFKHSHQLQLGS